VKESDIIADERFKAIIDAEIESNCSDQLTPKQSVGRHMFHDSRFGHYQPTL
jgi:hypothetical protein